MATTSTTGRKKVPRGLGRHPGASWIAKAAVWAAVGVDVAVLVVGLVVSSDHTLGFGLDMALWIVAAALVGFASIDTHAGPQLGLDMPLLLAAGYVLGPIPAGVVAFAGYIDIREFRGEIAIDRALFNRAQTSLSVIAATSLFQFLGGTMGAWPRSILPALAAVGVDAIVNFGLVAGVIALHDRVGPAVSLSRLRLGSIAPFAATYACFGLLSLLLSEVYVAVGGWGLALFASPLVLARQALSTRQELDGAQRRVRRQELALIEASDRVAHERRDERLAVAAGLHDEVLPPLFKVHLLGQVLRQELATGQLLALEDDLPALISATDEASQLLREQIRSLRTSSLGTHGLAGTLRLLVRQLEADSSARFAMEIDDVQATPVVELLAYQVGREALRNAVRHSDASRIRLALAREQDTLRIVVEDDGCGFVPHQVRDDDHFGIALMRERVELAGGILSVESSIGTGTRVIARLPVADSIQA